MSLVHRSIARHGSIRVFALLLFLVMGSLVIGSSDSSADDSKQPEPNGERRQRLAKYLTNCDFVGRFTTDGQTGKPPKEERYTIRSCQALDQPEMYELKVRIQYGSVDSEVPMNVRIVFADQTPVITLDQVWIPGMGTFDARVMIRRDRYAGTWQHNDHGGHLFGAIEQREEVTQPRDVNEAPESSEPPEE